MEREPLREAIRRELTERIISGALGAGDRIRLADTAKDIGVSITPLRESLVQLEVDGFVSNDPGCGYSVVEMSATEVWDIYPMIWTLEGLALTLAPPTDETLRELSEINRRFRACADPREARHLDEAWHGTLLNQCTNQTLIEFLTVLKRRAARYEVAFMRERQRLGSTASADQHDQVVTELHAGDLAAAREILEENWRTGPRELLPWMEKRGVVE